MLEFIIKRDGRREPFDASKLNKWSIWAARNIITRVDWASVVMKTVKSLGKEVESKVLNEELIRNLVRAKRWPEQLMAGGLYASDSRKEIFGGALPSVRKLHQQLVALKLMEKMKYTDEDYMYVERMIDHTRDFTMALFQVKQMRKKYSIRNEVKNIEYETPQFTFMRMAMALAENSPLEERLPRIESLYNSFSMFRVNAPTPNYINLGTQLKGFASCCLYSVTDSIESLAAGDHIAYKMTAISAGIGNILMTRSLGNPIRGGKITHQGKLPYFRSQAGAVTANKQAGRAGADTTYVSIFDPEIETIIMLQNPRSPIDKRNRDIHFAILHNKLITKKMAKNEDVFLFNIKNAPDLYQAQFSGDSDAFEALYSQYEMNPDFIKHYVSARELVVKFRQQRNEVSTLYGFQIDEANRHTPHKDPIRSANLCIEVAQPTQPYLSTEQLYVEGDLSRITFKTGIFDKWELKGESMYETDRGLIRGCYLKEGDTITDENGVKMVAEKFLGYYRNPEVSTCSLGGIVVSHTDDDVLYEQACYDAAVMIDECVHKSDFPLPHVRWTALQRLNAGIGILGLAHHMARKNLKWNTPEGLIEIDKVMERHAYFCIKAALRLGQERGNAPWMHRTKWPEGWLPIDTYKKNVDELVPFELRYPWEELRSAIIANGGIRFSSVVQLMPTESSSKASGAPNGPYQIRDLDLKKSDSSNLLDWCAPDNDILADQYHLAWDTTPIEQIKYYSVMQKWTDGSISADIYRDRTHFTVDEKGMKVINPITDEELIEEQLAITYYGNKGEYYMNAFTGGKVILDDEPNDDILDQVVEVLESGCEGACTL